MTSNYINTLTYEGNLITGEGKVIKILKMEACADEKILNEWATEFRKNYCLDDEIDILRAGYGYSK